MPGYSLKKSLAIHEAGHCAAAWLLGHKIKGVHLGDGLTGGVELARAPGWPSAEAMQARTVILLAGSDAERTWCAQNPDAPAAWLERVTEGRTHDLDRARAVALRVCGSDVALAKTYLGCVRDQVLDLTGRNSAGREIRSSGG